MLVNPKLGQPVRINYKNKSMPLQGMEGVISVVGKGKPRNHGVTVAGVVYVIPCGNLCKLTRN